MRLPMVYGYETKCSQSRNRMFMGMEQRECLKRKSLAIVIG